MKCELVFHRMWTVGWHSSTVMLLLIFLNCNVACFLCSPHQLGIWFIPLDTVLPVYQWYPVIPAYICCDTLKEFSISFAWLLSCTSLDGASLHLRALYVRYHVGAAVYTVIGIDNISRLFWWTKTSTQHKVWRSCFLRCRPSHMKHSRSRHKTTIIKHCLKGISKPFFSVSY